MECYWQVGEGGWRKGRVSTTGSLMLALESGGGQAREAVCLLHPEYIFTFRRLAVMGFVLSPADGTYRLVRVEVAFRKADVPPGEREGL